MEFKHTFDGKRLKNHVIRKATVVDAEFCEHLCFMESNCDSYNLKKSAMSDGKFLCELNNATFEGQKGKMETDPRYLYRGIENACLQNSCQNNASCQTGFTQKGYRCVCTDAFRGPYCDKGYSSCKEIYDRLKTSENRKYLLQLPSGKIHAYCHMSNHGLGACGGGGWTLVMKIDGHKKTFRFDSKLWNNKDGLKMSAGETLFDNQETKLPTYWSTNFSKICLGMKNGHNTYFTVISKEASSLFSLIADGEYRSTSLGRDKWKSLIGSEGSLQTNCGKEGFNAKCHNPVYSKARIGILGNNEKDCETCDSRIGFGIAGREIKPNTCGIRAKYYPDNGDKNIQTMGYILVQ